jgi:hypothetical protein
MKHRIYFRDCVAGKMYPNELYDNIFKMMERINARVFGVEVTSLHEFISFPLRNEMVRRGLNYEMIELTATGKKEDRIAQLAPLYRKHLIFHNKAVSTQLEEQLLSFPRSKRLDVMDAFSYVIKMLDEGDRYFFPKTEQATEKELEELGEEDYSELYEELEPEEEEKMIASGNWRQI